MFPKTGISGRAHMGIQSYPVYIAPVYIMINIRFISTFFGVWISSLIVISSHIYTGLYQHPGYIDIIGNLNISPRCRYKPDMTVVGAGRHFRINNLTMTNLTDTTMPKLRNRLKQRIFKIEITLDSVIASVFGNLARSGNIVKYFMTIFALKTKFELSITFLN